VTAVPATILGLPTWQDFKPFIVAGLALGGVYAVSGVGMVVLYRTTGVLNLAFGAVGAMGAFIAWQITQSSGVPDVVAYMVAVVFGGVVTLLYGSLFGPILADRDALTKSVATLGLLLILLGLMSWIWSDKARSLDLATTNSGFSVAGVLVNWTQVIALAFGIVVALATMVFLRVTRLGTAMRALADDREITATLGVPVRRIEALAWFNSGLISGAAGILLANLVGLDAPTLTFLVISSLAAALIARLRSVAWTLVAGIAVGLVNALATPILAISDYRDMAPFVMATVALLWLSRKDVHLTGMR
jgi:branched-chain amino acid transport system permease protein